MARLPALIDVLSKDDVRGRAGVVHAARMIREAGLITTTKRGRGAAEMTVDDAVALLIGLNCAESPGSEPDAIVRFSKLSQVRMETLPPQMENLPQLSFQIPAVLTPIVRAKTFSKALAHVIIALPELKNLAASSKPDRSPFPISAYAALLRDIPAPNKLVLRVSFMLTYTSAVIEIGWGGTATIHDARILRLYYSTRGNKMEDEFFQSIDRERNVVVNIGNNPIERLHSVLWPEGYMSSSGKGSSSDG